MYRNPEKYASLPLGIVIRRSPGVTRWAAWSWTCVAVLPGAGPADWKPLRAEGEVSEYHAATVTLELHGAETEAYVHGLEAEVPGVFVVMRATGDEARPFDVVLVTASPYEAQDYANNAEDVVEKVAMPQGLMAWVEDFVARFHHEEPFTKRRRDRMRVDRIDDGKGDARIEQLSDVYRAPGSAKRGRQS